MDNPFGQAIPYTYNGAGRLISCMDKAGSVHVMNYDSTGKPKVAVPLADAVVPVPPAANTVRRFVHTFEFRLSSSEEAKQSIPLPHLLVSGCLMAATKAVRMSVTRSPDRATTSIGGVEVHAEVRGKHVICVGRVTDFTADDLVVVQADVIVCSEQVLPNE
jgi:YD repeat-containing protein